ncbi:hypothetical protein [Pimelobacter simplex]|uniref:hypothetical protein n=1 Tax=Nocardioides simplex TaxID=2045 RepID=UPI003AAFB463
MPYAVKVEVAFNAGYKTPAVDRAWTDITSYVDVEAVGNALSIAYGRADELSTTDANRLTNLTLDNKDGRFTFDKASSPYYPNVKVGRPIRVTVTAGATTSVRYTGYVEEWPVDWPGGSSGYATARISAASRASRLGLTSAPPDYLDTEIRLEAPTYYWPMADQSSALRAAESSGGPAILNVRKLEFGYGGKSASEGVAFNVDGRPAIRVPLNDYDDSVDAAPGGLGRATFPAPVMFGPGVPGAVSLSVFIRRNSIGSGMDDTILALCERSKINKTLGASIEIGAMGSRCWSWGNGSTSETGTPLIFHPALLGTDKNPHHVGITLVCNGTTVTMSSWFDGVLMGSGTSPSPILPFVLDTLDLRGGRVDVVLGRIAMWNYAVSGATFQRIARTIAGYSGDTVDERMNRVAVSWAGIPTAEVTLPGSGRALGPMGTADGLPKPLDLLREVERDEAGVLHDDRAGKLVLRPRGARYGAPVALTIDASLHRVGTDWAPKADRQGLANMGVGKSTFGNADDQVTYIDESSRDEYGDALYTVETSALDPDEPLMRAAAAVTANSQPRPRAPSVTLDVNDWLSSPTDLAALLALDIGSRVRLTNAPAQAASSSVDYYVEGYTETLDPFRWTITLNLSPSWPADSVLILDDPAMGVLDQRVLAL